MVITRQSKGYARFKESIGSMRFFMGAENWRWVVPPMTKGPFLVTCA
jgi:hypothetical protein